MKRGRLILFLKAPRLGAVKTRLGASIGSLAAWRFYNAMLTGYGGGLRKSSAGGRSWPSAPTKVPRAGPLVWRGKPRAVANWAGAWPAP